MVVGNISESNKNGETFDYRKSSTNFDTYFRGRRIIDIRYFMKQLLQFPHHGAFSCVLENVEITKEIRKGFFSTFILSCNMCKETRKVFSEDPLAQTMNVNTCAVAGVISTGGGFSQLKEFTSTLDIPSMSFSFYKKIEKNLSDVYIEKSKEIIKEAGSEERTLAIETGDVDESGTPFISVIADGAYSKRSYRTSYSAHSGVACIIGERTNKILFLGIKNKYCCVCHMTKGKVPKHTCFKNYTGPSSGMETKALVEGFKMSMRMHGLKYKYLIADGDSTVFKKILEDRPYGDFLVEKIECKNHLLRNYCTKLRDLTTKKHSSSGKIVPLELRSELKSNILRLRTAVESSIKYHTKSNMPIQEKIIKIKQDLNNSPYHIFNYHQNCASYFCKKQAENDDEKLKTIMNTGLMNDIMNHINRLKYHAFSLLKNKNNNYAEHFNAIVAKFIGAKRIHFSSRGAFTMRCHAAAISYNSKGKYHSSIYKACTGSSPGAHTKKFIQARINERNYRTKRRLLFKESNYHKKKPRITEFTNDGEDYGPMADKPIELSDEDLEIMKSDLMKSLNTNFDTLEEATRNQRNSSLWKSERRKRLTASNFGKICKLREKTNRAKIVKDLLFPKFLGNKYVAYGIENEPIALAEFESVIKSKVKPCGLYVYKEYPYIAASPDGLINEDEIVEIKCPYVSKDTTPAEAILQKKIKFAFIDDSGFHLKRKDNYFYQVQGQLMVTNKKFCYFVVWSPKGLVFEKIAFDYDFCQQFILPKLKDFYLNHLLPALLKEKLNESN